MSDTLDDWLIDYKARSGKTTEMTPAACRAAKRNPAEEAVSSASLPGAVVVERPAKLAFMKPSALYLACYDIRDHRRLRQALNVLRDYALGRQKSVFECPLDPGDTGALVDSVKTVIDESEDRFVLVRLDRRGAMHAIGRGVVVEDDDDIFYVG